MIQYKYKNYSLINELKKENKLDSQFVFQIEALTLEEIIGIKLETMCRNLNFKFYSFPLWNSISRIVRDALLKSTFNIASSKSEAARILGIDLKSYKKYLKEYGYEVQR